MGELTFVVIADVHGNRWALEAVLEDIQRRGLGTIVNLGDSLYGPLDPAGTARLLREVDPLSIRGNEDRLILDPGPEEEQSATLQWVIQSLTPVDLEWLGRHRPGPEVLSDRILLCHGTPECDSEYLVERVCEGSVELKTPEELEAEFMRAAVEVILCAHSHVPRAIWLSSGRLIVNPGSVGLPAYTDDQPYFHAMEAGSPHARYAVLSWMKHRWTVEQISVLYDWRAAAQQAHTQGRTDWANWLQTGQTRD